MSVSPAGSDLRRLTIDGKPVLPFWVKVGAEDPLEGGGPDRWAKVQYTLQQAANVGALPIVAFGTDRLIRNSSAVEGGTDWQFSEGKPFDNRTEDLFDNRIVNTTGPVCIAAPDYFIIQWVYYLCFGNPLYC